MSCKEFICNNKSFIQIKDLGRSNIITVGKRGRVGFFNEKLTICKNQWNFHDKIPRLLENLKRTDTLQLITKLRVAGQLLNIPLM